MKKLSGKISSERGLALALGEQGDNLAVMSGFKDHPRPMSLPAGPKEACRKPALSFLYVRRQLVL